MTTGFTASRIRIVFTSVLSSHRWVSRYAVLLVMPAIIVICPNAATSAVMELWNSREVDQVLVDELEYSRRLDEQDETIRRRITLKESLVDNLVDGHTTLTAVIEGFTQLDQERPDYVPSLLATLPGQSDQEKILRNILNYVELRLQPGPKREEFIDNLQREFRQLDCASPSNVQ